MSTRISVALPDSLYERLQAVKDELNISYICQQAIKSEVILEEVKQESMQDREQVIKRLRQEMKNDLSKAFRKGKRLGLEIAPDLSYLAFHRFVKYQSFVDRRSGVISDKTIGHVKERLNALFREEHKPNCAQALLPEYYKGVIAGVVEFWKEIEPEVENFDDSDIA